MTITADIKPEVHAELARQAAARGTGLGPVSHAAGAMIFSLFR